MSSVETFDIISKCQLSKFRCTVSYRSVKALHPLASPRALVWLVRKGSRMSDRLSIPASCSVSAVQGRWIPVLYDLAHVDRWEPYILGLDLYDTDHAQLLITAR